MECGRVIIKEFKFKMVVVWYMRDCVILEVEFLNVKFFNGLEGFREVVIYLDGDVFLNVVMGSVGLFLILDVIEVGKVIVIVNKEMFVMVGYLVMCVVKEKNILLLFVDSEYFVIL